MKENLEVNHWTKIKKNDVNGKISRRTMKKINEKRDYVEPNTQG
jgi:hypothetical protein